MATDPAVNGQEREPAIAASVGIVGVRFVGAAEICFCYAGGIAYAAGDWVLVEGHTVQRVGRVVVTADGWAGMPDETGWSVSPNLQPAEVNAIVTVDIEHTGSEGKRSQVGSTGSLPKVDAAKVQWLTEALSLEDDRFRRSKRSLPSLGQTVSTQKGEGTVIAVDVMRRSVTCALAADASEIVESADRLSWVSPVTGGGRG